eukprot:14969810-Alexandrium_andersonii.AAC.1
MSASLVGSEMCIRDRFDAWVGLMRFSSSGKLWCRAWAACVQMTSMERRQGVGTTWKLHEPSWSR